MMTEQIEPLPEMQSPVTKTPDVQIRQQPQTKQETQDKQVKPKVKGGGRTKGRISTPERKPVRKEPIYIPREDAKKKKGLIYIVVCFPHCCVCVFLMTLFLFVV